MPTNEDRALRAQSALKYYTDGALDQSDLLADLMHYCTTKGIEFDDELSIARGNYTAELEGD